MQPEAQLVTNWPNTSTDPLHSFSYDLNDSESHTVLGVDDLEGADALEWDESTELTLTADGIGSLSLDQTGTGYMGPQSGNALLRTLQRSSMLLRSPNNAQVPALSPEPQISAQVILSTTFESKCLDYYFRYFNNAYPILHEGYFRAQYSGKTHHCSRPVRC